MNMMATKPGVANVFDLPPSEFNSFIQEEQQYRSADEINNLLRQYNENNSIFGKVQKLMAPKDGRVRTNYFPASVPEGMSLFEALKSGDANLAMPQALIDAITLGAKGLENPGIALRGTMPTDEANTAGMETAGLAMGASGLLAGKDLLNYDPTTARIFAGKRATLQDNDMLGRMKQAEDLFFQGKKNRDVFNETGVFKGADGKLRFEIDDTNSKLNVDVLHKLNLNKDDLSIVKMNVGDFLDHPDLYALYPDLKNLPLRFKKKEFGEATGSFSPSSKTITLAVDDPKQMRSVLMHEMQHAVQDKEGFSRGSNPEFGYSNQQKEKFINNLFSTTKAQRAKYASESFDHQYDLLKPLYKADYIDRLNHIVRKAFDGRAKPADIHRLSDWYKYSDDIRSRSGMMPKKPGVDRDNWIASAAAYIRDARLEEMSFNDKILYEQMRKNFPTSKDIKNAIRRHERKVETHRKGAFEYKDLQQRARELKDLNDYEAYLREAGEVEARTVQNRLDTNRPEGKFNFPPDSADFLPEQQILSNLEYKADTYPDVSSANNIPIFNTINETPARPVFKELEQYFRKEGKMR